MPKNKRRKPKAESTNLRGIILKILVGSALNVILYSALCVIFSLVSFKADFDLSMYKYFIFAISAVSGFFGGFKAVGAIRCAERLARIFDYFSCCVNHKPHGNSRLGQDIGNNNDGILGCRRNSQRK